MYTSEFFYSHRWSTDNNKRTNSYQITEKMVEQIKSLKTHLSNESGYYDTMLQWRIEDNTHLTKKELNEIYPAMQFISMIAKIKPEFIQKYNVQDWQIALLRGLYLDWDDYDSEGLITMGFKRPFGNSHVLGDVRYEMVRYGDPAAIQRDSSDQDSHSEEQEALNQFVDILEKFYQEGFELQVESFVQTNFNGSFNRDSTDWLEYADKNFQLHSYLYDWKPDISVIRDKKLSQLI